MSRSSNRRSNPAALIRGGIGLIVATACAAGVAAGAHGDPSPSPAATAGTTAPALALPPIAPIAQSFTKALSATFDASIDPIATDPAALDKQAPAIDEADALLAARGGAGIDDRGEAVSATLAHVTLGQYGQQLELDPTKPSRISPTIANRQAWVIQFDNAPVPVFGKPGYTGPPESKGPLVAFIDATTGEFLAAVAY